MCPDTCVSPLVRLTQTGEFGQMDLDPEIIQKGIQSRLAGRKE